MKHVEKGNVHTYTHVTFLDVLLPYYLALLLINQALQFLCPEATQVTRYDPPTHTQPPSLRKTFDTPYALHI